MAGLSDQDKEWVRLFAHSGGLGGAVLIPAIAAWRREKHRFPGNDDASPGDSLLAQLRGFLAGFPGIPQKRLTTDGTKLRITATTGQPTPFSQVEHERYGPSIGASLPEPALTQLQLLVLPSPEVTWS